MVTKPRNRDGTKKRRAPTADDAAPPAKSVSPGRREVTAATPAQLAQQEQHSTALRMRRLGFTFSAIAEHLRIDVSEAHRVIARAMRSERALYRADAEDLRHQYLTRLEGLLPRLHRTAMNDMTDRHGPVDVPIAQQIRAAEAIVKITAEMATLSGVRTVQVSLSVDGVEDMQRMMADDVAVELARELALRQAQLTKQVVEVDDWIAVPPTPTTER